MHSPRWSCSCMRSRTRPTNCWNPSQTSAAQKTFNAIDAKIGHGNIFVSTRNWNARDRFFLLFYFFWMVESSNPYTPSRNQVLHLRKRKKNLNLHWCIVIKYLILETKPLAVDFSDTLSFYKAILLSEMLLSILCSCFPLKTLKENKSIEFHSTAISYWIIGTQGLLHTWYLENIFPRD